MQLHLKSMMADKAFSFNIVKGFMTEQWGMHAHDFSELEIILGGTATHMIGNRDIQIKRGDIYAISGDVEHGYKDVKHLELCSIQYRHEQLVRVTAELKTMPGFQSLFILEPRFRNEFDFLKTFSIAQDKLSDIVQLLNVLVTEYNDMNPGYRTNIQSVFTQVIVFLSREYSKDVDSSSHHLMGLARAVAYMENNYLMPLSLRNIADKAYMSVRNFSRVFHNTYLDTPINHILKLRVEHSCGLLVTTDMSMTEIAFESGFSDGSYFTRQFKKHTGQTPTAFRRGATADFIAT